MAKKTAEPRYKVMASADSRSSLRAFTIEGSLRQSRTQRDDATRHLRDSPIHRVTLSHWQSQRKNRRHQQDRYEQFHHEEIQKSDAITSYASRAIETLNRREIQATDSGD